MEPLLLTPDQAAEALQISKSYLYELKSRNLIPHVKIGANLRFRPEDLREYVNDLAKTARRKQRLKEFQP